MFSLLASRSFWAFSPTCPSMLRPESGCKELAVLTPERYAQYLHHDQILTAPPGLPILGNVLDLKKDPYLPPTFRKWRQACGPIVEFSVMGQKHVVISDGKMVRDLVARRGDVYYDKGRSPVVDIVTNSIATFSFDRNGTSCASPDRIMTECGRYLAAATESEEHGLFASRRLEIRTLHRP